MPDDDPLGQTLRELGARTRSRPDGYEFHFAGVTGTYLLGEELDDREIGPFTVCRVPLPPGGPAFLMELRPQTPEESRAVQSGEALDFEVGHGEFDRAFVIEAAPSSVVHVLLDEPTQLDHRQSGGLALSTEERFFVASTGALDEDGEHGVGAAAR